MLRNNPVQESHIVVQVLYFARSQIEKENDTHVSNHHSHLHRISSFYDGYFN